MAGVWPEGHVGLHTRRLLSHGCTVVTGGRVACCEGVILRCCQAACPPCTLHTCFSVTVGVSCVNMRRQLRVSCILVYW